VQGGRQPPRRSDHPLSHLAVCLLAGLAVSCGSPSTFGPAEGEGNYAGVIEVDGRERSYLVHMAPGVEGAGAPLVLALHGSPSTPQVMQALSGFDAIADEAGIVVAYPRYVFGQWAVGCGEDCELEGDRDKNFMRALIDELHDRLGIDRGRVYLTGFSNGGLTTYHLACELSDRFAAAAPVGALMIEPQWQSCPLSPAVPILMIHGTEDGQFPWEGGVGVSTTRMSADATVQRLAALDGCGATPTITFEPDTADDGTRVRREHYTGCTGSAEVIFYVVEGGGHTWPGSPLAFDPEVGAHSRDIVAQEIIVDFFLRHSRP
jgi:polyhydroxybutyrate depolymerase